jgi:hypothetical protein
VANEEPVPPLSLDMPGGAEAPRQARTAVREALRPHLSADAVRDVALVVSELVTSSVDRDGAGHTRVWCELPLSRT